MPLMVQVGAYIIPTGVFVLCSHLAPTAAVGSNCHIWFVDPTLILNPPRMYSLLLNTVNPPGRGVGHRVVGENAGGGCSAGSKAAAHAIDGRSARNGEHATSHVVHEVVRQCYAHLGPAVGRGGVAEYVLEVRPYQI